MAEVESNSETILIADVNPGLLKQLHEKGSVRNLQQRRQDLVQEKWKE